MVGQAVIAHRGVTVSNNAVFNVKAITVSGKKVAYRTVTLHGPFNLKGVPKTGMIVDGAFKGPRSFGFRGVIKEIKDAQLIIEIEGDYSEDFGRTIKKVEKWQLFTEG